MTPTVELEYADTPPSLNRVGTRGSHWKVNNAKTRWQGIFGQLLMTSGIPRSRKRVRARATLRFPTQRRRDPGNFGWIIEKALGDALVAGRWIPDDTGEHFRLENVHVDDVGPARTLLVLEWEP